MTRGQFLEDWGLEGIWEDFKAHRAEICTMKASAKPFTPTAEKRAIAKLGRLREQGSDPRAVIDRSIDRGWIGLYALPDDQRTAFKEQSEPAPPWLSIEERSRESWAKHDQGLRPIGEVLKAMRAREG